MTLVVQLTDLHVRPEGVPSSRVVETNAMTDRALRAVARLRPIPDAVLITGDLTDCGLPEEYRLLAAMLGRHLTIPVHVIPGNHDRREEMCTHLPGTRSQDGFLHYTVETLPLRLIMLDTVVPGAGHGELCDRRLAWLETRLAEASNRPTLIAMHHPPFRCGIAHMDRIALHDPGRFAALVARHPQVERIICGHHHRSITARIGHATASVAPSVAHQVELDLADTAPSAFMLEPPAYQIHHWSPEGGVVSHTAYVETYPGPFPFLIPPEYPGQS